MLLLTSAERLGADKAALLAAAMDEGPSRFSIIACDEGIEDERLPVDPVGALGLPASTFGCDAAPELDGLDLEPARRLLPHVTVPDHITEGLCQTALALGIRPAARRDGASRRARRRRPRRAHDGG